MVDWILANSALISTGFAALVALCTTITRLTPSDRDDYLLKQAIRIFSLVSKHGKWTE
jgi:hypothetical protein